MKPGLNFLLYIIVVARQSPKSIERDVDDVGTIPVGSDSFTFGNKIFISLAFNRRLSGFDATPMILIPNLFANFNIFVSSKVFPEFEKIINNYKKEDYMKNLKLILVLSNCIYLETKLY